VADRNIGSGTLVLSFITGLAAGVATVLLIDAKRVDKKTHDEQEEHMFI
jgi:hypothetical protein